MFFALLIAQMPAVAVEPEVVERHAELSMLVTGSIEVDSAGNVRTYSLDKTEKLPAAVTEWAARKIPDWKFQTPAGAGGAPVRNVMNLRFAARRLDADRYALRVASAGFYRENREDYITARKLKPPRYPQLAGMGGITGIVYVVAKVGRDGRVEDVVAEQVNLRVISSEAGMNEWRAMFARVALDAARDWTFTPPRQGPRVGDPFWSVRVPVEFVVAGKTVQPGYGEWAGYVPGPRQRAPWSHGGEDAGADAVPAGGIYPADPELELLTPLDKAGA